MIKSIFASTTKPYYNRTKVKSIIVPHVLSFTEVIYDYHCGIFYFSVMMTSGKDITFAYQTYDEAQEERKKLIDAITDYYFGLAKKEV